MILAENPITHQHPQTAEETIHPTLTAEVEEQAQHWFEKFREYWHWGALGLVAIHTTYGTWEVLHFLIAEYPHLEHQLHSHVITANEVDFFIAQAIVRSALTVVNAGMTVRLRKVKESVASSLDLIGATMLALATPLLQHYLENLHIVNQIAKFFE